ncbi:MAG: twin-arginine translocation signal domain-containing protein [Bacteroidales bacterium]|nr:twin-arginine translocation signal domain-containing protein [Bacteroidales bacterium]
METQNNSRRSFIKKAAIGTLAAISIPEILSAAVPKGGSKK